MFPFSWARQVLPTPVPVALWFSQVVLTHLRGPTELTELLGCDTCKSVLRWVLGTSTHPSAVQGCNLALGPGAENQCFWRSISCPHEQSL